MDTSYPHPGAVIKRARETAGLTQEAAAQRADVPLSSYRKYEQGAVEPPHERLQAILAVLEEGATSDEVSVSQGEAVGADTSGQSITSAISSTEQFYLVVHVGDAVIRFPLGPPKLEGDIEMDASAAFITGEETPITERNPNN